MHRPDMLRVLWITNVQFPFIKEKMGLPAEVVGGWMYSLAAALVETKNVSLAVATIYNGTDIKYYYDDSIRYYLLPGGQVSGRYNNMLGKYWQSVLNEFSPEVIHIHGTEYPHGLACMTACPDNNYVISIQGLLSVFYEYYHAGISSLKLLKFTTLNDIRHRNTVWRIERRLKKRAKYELQYLQRCSNIIGRTSWDYSHVKAVNPNVTYHFCNESLRRTFYTFPKWDLSKKQDYTIFMSQANSQRKGLHQALEALKLVKEYYPGVQLRVAGPDISGGSKWVHRNTTYGAYIRSLLSKSGLKDHVKFLGRLDEESMARELYSAHIYLCASAIENSPNSLGEAQLIGTPSIASFVGGVPDMVKDGETGLLYRYEEPSMLAFKIIKLFEDDNLAVSLSRNGIVFATERHNWNTITERIIEIYLLLRG